MDQVSEPITCMIDHPGLDPVCLNIYSLQNAMNIYRVDNGRLRIRGMERWGQSDPEYKSKVYNQYAFIISWAYYKNTQFDQDNRMTNFIMCQHNHPVLY